MPTNLAEIASEVGADVPSGAGISQRMQRASAHLDEEAEVAAAGGHAGFYGGGRLRIEYRPVRHWQTEQRQLDCGCPGASMSMSSLPPKGSEQDRVKLRCLHGWERAANQQCDFEYRWWVSS
jgi:hypothetical protein